PRPLIDITTDRDTQTLASPNRTPSPWHAAFDTSRLIGHTVTATFGSRSGLRLRMGPSCGGGRPSPGGGDVGEPPQDRLLVPAGRRAAPAAPHAADEERLARR